MLTAGSHSGKMAAMASENQLYGGQAVIEGVMMRGRHAYAVAVRDPHKNIVVHTEPLNPHIYDSVISRTPFLRGLTMLWDALGIGIKSLMFSADIAGEEEKQEAGGGGEEAPEERDPRAVFKEPMMVGAVLLSLAMSIGLFIALPAFLAGLFVYNPDNHLASNLLEGVVRLVLVIGYIWGIGRIPDIQRVFAYHGAEHKTINAYEAGAELTPESVARFPLEHPRCGTGFLLTVVLISIILFSLIPPLDAGFALNLLFRVLSRILLIPIVAGIAYEFLRFTARYRHIAFVRAVTRPNMALQRLTTREPDLDMLAVAIEAFSRVRAIDLEKLGQQAAEAELAPSTAAAT